MLSNELSIIFRPYIIQQLNRPCDRPCDRPYERHSLDIY